MTIPTQESEILIALKTHANQYPQQMRRVRLLLSQDGEIEIESVPYIPFDKDTVHTVALAKQAIDRNNRFFYHKTTHRQIYDEHKSMFPHAFDVLLWNDKKEITEFTIGNIVVKMNGEYFTPPVSCGLLAGTLREELVETGEITEQIIRIDDLKDADHIWMINSLRGWVPVQIDQMDKGSAADL